MTRCCLLFLSSLVLAGYLQVGHRAAPGQFEALLDLGFQCLFDTVVPNESHLCVGVEFEGLVHPAEVAVMVGVKEALGFVEHRGFVLVQPQAAPESIELRAKRIDVRLLEQFLRNPVEGFDTTTFGQRQDSLCVAVQRNGSISLEFVAKIDELFAEGCVAGILADALPWQSGKDGGVLALVGRLKKRRQCRQRRCLEESMP
jgi:hypothetical protein